MSVVSVKMNGLEALERKLSEMNSIRFDAVVEMQMVDMVDRATRNLNASQGGTPYDTGELIQSIGKIGTGKEAEMGYSKDYAPHVEYGHRTVKGGYVEGQRFLRRNVEIQQPIYKQDLLNAIRKG